MGLSEESGLFDVGEFDIASFDTVVFDDSTTSTDSIKNKLDRIFNDSTTSTDSIKNKLDRIFNDSTTSTDSIIKFIDRLFNDSTTSSDDIIKKLDRILNDSSVSSDLIAKKIDRILNDSTTSTDDFTAIKKMFTLLSETVNTIDSITKLINYNLNDSVIFDDEDRNALFDFAEFDVALFDATDRPQGSFSKSLSIDRFNESVSATDSIIKKTLIELNELTTSIDLISKDISREFGESSSLTDTIQLTKRVIREFIEAITTDDNICLNKISGQVLEIKNDFITVLNDIMNEQVQLIKQTDTETDGFISDLTELKFCITCRIMPVSQKTRNLIEIGNFVTGDMIGYFYPLYTFKNVSYEVMEDDIIFDSKNNIRYRVISVPQREHLNNEVIYIKCVLRRINEV